MMIGINNAVNVIKVTLSKEVMKTELQKALEDFRTSYEILGTRLPAMDIHEEEGHATIHFDVSVHGNGATRPTYCSTQLIKMMTNDNIGLMSSEMFEAKEWNFKYKSMNDRYEMERQQALNPLTHEQSK